MQNTEPYRVVLSLGGTPDVAVKLVNRLGFRFGTYFDTAVTPLAEVQKIITDGAAVLSGPKQNCYGDESDDAQPRRRYEEFQRLVEMRQRTLFVRFGGHHDRVASVPPKRDERPTTTEDLNGICSAISNRFPGLVFSLAFAWIAGITPVDIEDAALDPRVGRHELTDYGHSTVQDTVTWAGILGQYDIDLIRNRRTILKRTRLAMSDRAFARNTLRDFPRPPYALIGGRSG